MSLRCKTAAAGASGRCAGGSSEPGLNDQSVAAEPLWSPPRSHSKGADRSWTAWGHGFLAPPNLWMPPRPLRTPSGDRPLRSQGVQPEDSPDAVITFYSRQAISCPSSCPVMSCRPPEKFCTCPRQTLRSVTVVESCSQFLVSLVRRRPALASRIALPQEPQEQARQAAMKRLAPSIGSVRTDVEDGDRPAARAHQQVRARLQVLALQTLRYCACFA